MPTFSYAPSNKIEAATPYFLWDVNIVFSRSRSDFIVNDSDAIKIMIANVLFTIPGERVFEPEFGSDLPFLLHEPMNDITAWRIENASYRALSRWIPYIRVDRPNSRVVPDYDRGVYKASIPYYELSGASYFNKSATFSADVYAVR
jgi:phage baseplate assembly protein W